MANPEDIIGRLRRRNRRAAGKTAAGLNDKALSKFLMGALNEVNEVRREAAEAYAPEEKKAVVRKANKVRKKYRPM